MKSKNTPVSRKDNLVIQELEKELLIYDLSENKAFCLNQTSALVWQACDGTNNIAQISKFVGEKLNLPANEDLVWFAIDQLRKEKLIDNELPNHFEGIGRREVIKRVGLGTMIALPIVASIVAPRAINAASFAFACDGPNGTFDIGCYGCQSASGAAPACDILFNAQETANHYNCVASSCMQGPGQGEMKCCVCAGNFVFNSQVMMCCVSATGAICL